MIQIAPDNLALLLTVFGVVFISLGFIVGHAHGYHKGRANQLLDKIENKPEKTYKGRSL